MEVVEIKQRDCLTLKQRERKINPAQQVLKGGSGAKKERVVRESEEE